MTGVTRESTARALVLRRAAGAAWRALDTGRLLGHLAEPAPYDIRFAAAGDALVLAASLPPLPEVVAARLPWLEAALGGVPVPEHDDADPAPTLEVVRWVAARRHWVSNPTADGALRLAVPGEPELPPLLVSAAGGEVLVQRPVTHLPVHDPGTAVRAATAHAALQVNARLLFARLAIPDPRGLTAAVECRLPAGEEPLEDEIETVLDAVRHGARHAAGVLDPLRHPACASEYVRAHNLLEE
jgi:hypothetical protein